MSALAHLADFKSDISGGTRSAETGQVESQAALRETTYPCSDGGEENAQGVLGSLWILCDAHNNELDCSEQSHQRRIKITGTTTSTQEHTIAKARVVTNIAQNQPIKAVIGVLKKKPASADVKVTKAAIAAISAAISIGLDLPIYAQLPLVFVIQLNTRESTGPAISKAAKKLPRNIPRVECTTCVGVGVSTGSTPVD